MLARTHGSCTRNEVGLGDVGKFSGQRLSAPWVRKGRSFGPNVSALSFLRNFLVSKPRLSLIHDGRAGGLSQSASPPFAGTTSRSEFAATA